MRGVSDHRDAIDELLSQAEELPYGPTRTSLAEEAVRLADTHNDDEASFDARTALMQAAMFAGRPDVMLVNFAWCLALHDRNPESFPEFNLLWNYKWVVSNLPHFPEVSRTQIDEALADMGRRYQRAGASMHAVHHKRRWVLYELGDLDGSEQAHLELAHSPLDAFSDPADGVIEDTVGYLALVGRDEEALDAAEPILRRGSTVFGVLHHTYSHVVVPLLRQGRGDEAAKFYRKGYRLISTNPYYTRELSRHLQFTCLSDNVDAAVRLLERHLPAALTLPNLRARFDFLAAARLLFVLLRERGTSQIRLRLPPTFPLHEPKGRYAVEPLMAWAEGESRALAGRFDARNGNDYYTRILDGVSVLKRQVTPHPLTKSRRPQS
jgi:hypothetical protein